MQQLSFKLVVQQITLSLPEWWFYSQWVGGQLTLEVVMVNHCGQSTVAGIEQDILLQ